MTYVRSRFFSGLIFAIYGFYAVVGPAGLHDLIAHEHPASTAMPPSAHVHDHDHHHGHGHHAHNHQSPDHQHRPQGNSHSHFPGESDHCVVCQFMATAAQPTLPPSIELTGEQIAELILPALPARRCATTSSISIRGPPVDMSPFI
ncbi:MAG: hypothetical protein O2955_08595 [Planctomycetota bacterium]|nr:hypothetical protein [Planctomycetota bacterium]MDA1212563.1 hypothetical protein [Planctomycetota bacterium]